MTVYILDTNVISDMIAPRPNAGVLSNIRANRQDTICLSEAVDYEVRRGFLKTGATTRLTIYEQTIKPQFQWVAIIEADWQQAALFWATAVNMGKQLSDIDLLVAAVATRLEGVIVSADADFDVLPMRRVSWRI